MFTMVGTCSRHPSNEYACEEGRERTEWCNHHCTHGLCQSLLQHRQQLRRVGHEVAFATKRFDDLTRTTHDLNTSPATLLERGQGLSRHPAPHTFSYRDVGVRDVTGAYAMSSGSSGRPCSDQTACHIDNHT